MNFPNSPSITNYASNMNDQLLFSASAGQLLDRMANDFEKDMR